MSNRERAFELLEQIPDDKLFYIIGIMEKSFDFISQSKFHCDFDERYQRYLSGLLKFLERGVAHIAPIVAIHIKQYQRISTFWKKHILYQKQTDMISREGNTQLLTLNTILLMLDLEMPD